MEPPFVVRPYHRLVVTTQSQPASTFLAEEGFHFDNTASALGMTPAQYEGYLKAATDLMVELRTVEAVIGATRGVPSQGLR